jgi:predicted amidohydrolase YtcJ
MGIPVDLIVSARRVYTVDDAFSAAESMAISGGKIVAIGASDEINEAYTPQKRLDLGDAYVYPGFMDPHCHFLGYGYMLQRADLFGTRSWNEVVDRLVAWRKHSVENWILGRGWNQNEWSPKAFPTKQLLDEAFPNNPVLLTRIDGHAAIANDKALTLAGIDASTKVDGGIVLLSEGKPTGLLLDNAIDIVKKAIPEPSDGTMRRALTAAQSKCFAAGLTSVSNAGTQANEAALMDMMQTEGWLKIRIYAMLAPTPANIEKYALRGPYVKDRFTARSFKMYADGALGSRGALLLDPYSDDPGNFGLKTLRSEELERVCGIARANGFQMNVHAIGDAAVRLVLDSYQKFLKPGNDLRWRIEHAQIVHPDDFSRFGRLRVIPSVQTTHATSDMGWAQERLGPVRMRYAHAYRELLAQNGWLANGSDFPIERIEPLRGFRSGFARMDDSMRPVGGFQMENALTREQALRAMTIWAAKANFEERGRGSLEPGKWADFTVLDTDIMRDSEEAVWQTEVLATAIAGEIGFSA